MERQLSVLLYSNYSPHSKKLMNIIESSPDFIQLTNLQYLCVDNSRVRERIEKSNNMRVDTVPCILLVYSDGGIEKYDGSHAFRWVEEIITKYVTPPPPPTPTPPPPPKENKSAATTTSIDDLLSEDDNEHKDITKHIQIQQPVTKGIKNDKIDIMSAAQALQKDRDVDIESKRPAGMPKDK